jgi:hypothetical protein
MLICEVLFQDDIRIDSVMCNLTTFSAKLCVALRLSGIESRKTYKPQRHRGTQSFTEELGTDQLTP